MKKKLFSLLAALLLAFTGLVPAALAYDDTPMESEGYYYVYTENGKGLNVRDTPGGKVVGSLKYGTRVYCYYKDGGNGWALIDYKYNMPGVGYGTYACYISSRFLRKTKPPARKTGSSAAPAAAAASSTAAEAAPAGTIAEINAEYRSAKKVTPYAITLRPSRVSGWVNMLWAPSKEAEILATYKANDRLLVIRELDNWYQVEDQNTGDVGFINKQFTAQ